MTQGVNGHYVEKFCESLEDQTAIQAWKGALQECIESNTGKWVSWSTLFELWKNVKTNMEDLDDPGELLRSSGTLKEFVGRNPETGPPDPSSPDTPWGYDCQSRLTRILGAVTSARRKVSGDINNLESRLTIYRGNTIGNISTSLDSLTKELALFNDAIQKTRSGLTTLFEVELDNLLNRVKQDNEAYISLLSEVLNMLHQQESLMYMIRRERVESSVATIFLKWEGKSREEKANMVAERELTGVQPAESVQSVNRLLDAQMGRISWSMWTEKSFPESDKLVWKPSTDQLRRWKSNVEYPYTTLGEGISQTPIFLLHLSRDF